MRTHPLVVKTYILRGALTWLALRVVLSGVFLLAGERILSLSPLVIVEIIAISVGLEYLMMRIQRETVFLGNLGISPQVAFVTAGAPAVIGEVLLRIAGAFVRL